MPLAPGTRIGVYEVLAPLGAGGMGEVYRARDPKLGREVALKVLAEAVTHDPVRIACFRREAKLLASLNHPHIAGIHGLEDAGAITALVLELVEGPTLADRISGGRIPLVESLTIAIQIAEALEAAHGQGIVHRDLKPANIKVRPDGTVKVLDFGLAKAIEPAGQAPGFSHATTLTATTIAGIIIGTPAYMSPEQASGKSVDERSDVWSFGVVLFEMLTGRPLFGGETMSHVLAAVLREDPDWSLLPADTPAPVRRLLRHCLAKNPAHRLDSAVAVRLELEDAQVAPGEEPPPRRRSAVIATVVAAALLGGAATGAAVWLTTRTGRPAMAPVVRFGITPPAELALRPSTQAAARDFAVAPDGSFIVYRAGDRRQLAVRWFDRIDVAVLPDIVNATMPFVSPDGKWIGYVEDDLTLKKVAVSGGAPVTLARLPVWPRGATWVDAETIIIGTSSGTTGLLRVPAGGGEPTVLTTPDRAKGEEGHILPSVLPGGGAVLFTIGAAKPEDSQIAVFDLQSKEVTPLLRGGRDPQYVAPGHLVFLSGRAMSAVRFDPATRATVGEPVRVLDDLAMAPTSALNVAVTSNGTMVYLPSIAGTTPIRSLVWIDRSGRETQVGAPPRAYESVRLSPDGTRIAVNIRDQENDIWLWSMARQTLTRLTFDADVDVTPVWMPDSRRLVFGSARAGTYSLYGRDADGDAAEIRLASGPNTQLPDSVAPDGTTVIGREVAPQTRSDVVRFTLGPSWGEKPVASETLVGSPFDEWNGEVSPDGHFLAYESMESGISEIFVRRYPQVTGDRWQVSSGGGSEPVWSRDGRELLFLDADRNVTAVRVQSDPSRFRAAPPQRLGVKVYPVIAPWRTYDVSADGQRILMMKDVAGSTSATPTMGFEVVEHWQQELERLLPLRH